MLIDKYLNEIKKDFNLGKTTEHSFRGFLQNFLHDLVKEIHVTNEPKRQKCGAPDYIIQNKEVPIGYIETKDIGINLDKEEKSEQLKRYFRSLDNLILTDYLDFRFFRFGKKVKSIQIAIIENQKFIIYPENFDSLITHLKDFCQFKGQTIKSSEKLAKMMAQKARMMEEVIYKAVCDEEEDENTLREQLKAFKNILIHDLDEKTFSDIYAQTIAYGLFAARLHDESLEDFTREEARTLIPKSNPFLRQLFKYVSDPDLDIRISWIINDLADIFRATDLQSILIDFGDSTFQQDAFIHFYETFLAEYDPKLRKSRGVYYTPEPIVNFIVRAVDDILRDEFGLSQGLADTSKTKIEVETQVDDKRYKTGVRREEKEVHKVQILDPATGTGTFLAEVINRIYQKFVTQQGIWSSYVEKDLIPRLHGFELLMAPYTMCHLKLEMFLKQSGYKPKEENKQPRLRVYLTNSLEEAHPDTGTLWADWLAREAKEANYIKKDTPVMVILGNPPYSVSSSNKSEWIEVLMKDYKKDLDEKNINPLSDDYIKFIRFGQYFINKNGEGILAFISNNSFIDGLIHRQMRNELISHFNLIYILNLHGNSNRKEKAEDGSKDENVFDIQQGVSINIFIKKRTNKKCKINYYDILGNRILKYHFLLKENLKTIKWSILTPKKDYYFFSKKHFDSSGNYDKGFSISRLFNVFTSGIKTHRDTFIIDFDKHVLSKRIKDFLDNDFTNGLEKYNLKETDYFNSNKIKCLKFDSTKLKKITYRPFDIRYIYYEQEMIDRHRMNVMNNMLKSENIGLCIMRQYAYNIPNYCYAFLSIHILESRVFISNKGMASFAPLYLYNDNLELLNIQSIIPNLNIAIINRISDYIGIKYNTENKTTDLTFSPMDIFDYVYAVLHSNKYREAYRAELQIDYPKIPYPIDIDYFLTLVKFGSKLRTIHLFVNPLIKCFITTYPINDGYNTVVKVKYKNNKVYINKTQYFDNVPIIAWNFYIGGYQPAQKWLKDRKGRELSFEDIQHYQKIIVALTETDRIMKEIDKVIEL